MSCAPTIGEVPVVNVVIPRRAGCEGTLTYREKPTVKRVVSGVTKANPGKVTAASHGFANGDVRFLSKLKGMAQADGRAYTITVFDANNVTLGVDTSAYDAYVSGGVLDNGKPIDLTGYTARMHFRDKETDASPALNLTTENSGIVLGGTAGTARFIVTEVQAIALTLSEGVYEFVLIDGMSASRVLFEGEFTR